MLFSGSVIGLLPISGTRLLPGVAVILLPAVATRLASVVAATLWAVTATSLLSVVALSMLVLAVIGVLSATTVSLLSVIIIGLLSVAAVSLLAMAAVSLLSVVTTSLLSVVALSLVADLLFVATTVSLRVAAATLATATTTTMPTAEAATLLAFVATILLLPEAASIAAALVVERLPLDERRPLTVDRLLVRVPAFLWVSDRLAENVNCFSRVCGRLRVIAGRLRVGAAAVDGRFYVVAAMAVLQLPVVVDGTLSTMTGCRLIGVIDNRLMVIARSSITVIATLFLGIKLSRWWRTLAELPGGILRRTDLGLGYLRVRLLGVTIIRVGITRLTRVTRLLVSIYRRGQGADRWAREYSIRQRQCRVSIRPRD